MWRTISTSLLPFLQMHSVHVVYKSFSLPLCQLPIITILTIFEFSMCCSARNVAKGNLELDP